jgi:hypothetical protein
MKNNAVLKKEFLVKLTWVFFLQNNPPLNFTSVNIPKF